MEIEKFEALSKGDKIKADLYSRPNAMTGKYKMGNLGLDALADIKSKDVFFLETLKMKADLADKVIAEAESLGKNTRDPNIMKELGEKINAAGTPLHRSEAVITAIFASLQLIMYYGVAIGIWGLVFKKSFLAFGFGGIVIGILISLLSVGPVIAFQRTKEKVQEMCFGAGVIWINIARVIGAIGLIAWVMRLIFL